jgi:hypothetical protein
LLTPSSEEDELGADFMIQILAPNCFVPRQLPRQTNNLPLRTTVQLCSRLSLRQSSMPICISCSTPVKNLYTTYSKADDRSLGKGVRLTQCPRCKRFADKYVEHDFVVLFIDLVLIKPQVRDSMLVMASESELRTLD